MQRCAALACVWVAATVASYAQTSTPSSPQTTARPNPQHTAKSRKSKKSRKTASSRKRGQQKIDSQRARQIQEALIREHYLSGQATGKWDPKSEEAMRRYQGDHGWQTIQVPDSRALIKLGLGPSKDHLLNPETAMTSGPETPREGSSQGKADSTASSKSPTAATPTPASTATPATPQDPPAHPDADSSKPQ